MREELNRSFELDSVANGEGPVEEVDTEDSNRLWNEPRPTVLRVVVESEPKPGGLREKAELAEAACNGITQRISAHAAPMDGALRCKHLSREESADLVGNLTIWPGSVKQLPLDSCYQIHALLVRAVFVASFSLFLELEADLLPARHTKTWIH